MFQVADFSINEIFLPFTVARCKSATFSVQHTEDAATELSAENVDIIDKTDSLSKRLYTER